MIPDMVGFRSNVLLVFLCTLPFSDFYGKSGERTLMRSGRSLSQNLVRKMQKTGITIVSCRDLAQ